MKCKDCKWWDKDLSRTDKDDEGICRRYPPVMEGDDNRYPVVDDYEWCGEFKTKKVEKAKKKLDWGKCRRCNKDLTPLDYRGGDTVDCYECRSKSPLIA